MDNFPQFYKLLDSIFTKKDAGIEVDDDNFNLYLMNRYVSFYHPMICQLINETTNKMDFVVDPDNEEECMNLLKSIVPKLPWKRIEYISKPTSKTTQDCGYEQDEIEYLSRKYELGQREIRNLIYSAIERKKNNDKM